MGKVTLDLQPELEQAFGRIAQQTGQTRDAVLHEALEAYVARQSGPQGQVRTTLPPIDPTDVARLHDDDAKAQAEALLRGRPLFRSLGVGSDLELNGRDSEEWLKANWRPE